MPSCIAKCTTSIIVIQCVSAFFKYIYHVKLKKFLMFTLMYNCTVFTDFNESHVVKDMEIQSTEVGGDKFCEFLM